MESRAPSATTTTTARTIWRSRCRDRVVLFHNDGGGKFTDVTAKVGIEMPTQNYLPAGMTFVDYDHDGDLDLFVTGSYGVVGGDLEHVRPNFLWRNNGNGTFTKWTAEAGLQGEGSTTSAVLSDINNDRAVDLVVTNANGNCHRRSI